MNKEISLTRLQFFNLMCNALFVYGEEENASLNELLLYLKTLAELGPSK